MSSSSTETLVDVTMPQMGVSVAEGTVVEWKKQVGDWVEADEIIASISTDKIDTDVESPADRPRAGDPRRRRRRRSTSAPCWRGSPPTRSRARRTRPRTASRGHAARPTAALEAPGEAGELHGDTTERSRRRARRERRPRATRRS